MNKKEYDEKIDNYVDKDNSSKIIESINRNNKTVTNNFSIVQLDIDNIATELIKMNERLIKLELYNKNEKLEHKNEQKV